MSGGRKVIPRQAGSCPSALPIPLSHYLVRQSKGKTPSTWKIWSSYGTELTTCRTAKDDIGISTIEGSSPPTPKQTPLWVVQTNQDIEEEGQDVHLFISVFREEVKVLQARFQVHISGEDPQEDMHPPPRAKNYGERLALRVGHLEPYQ